MPLVLEKERDLEQKRRTRKTTVQAHIQVLRYKNRLNHFPTPSHNNSQVQDALKDFWVKTQSVRFRISLEYNEDEN